MKDLKVIYLDVETTGVDSSKHGIWQLAGYLEWGGNIYQEFNYKMKPAKGTMVDMAALKVGNMTITQLQQLPDEQEVFKEFETLLGGWINKLDTFDKAYVAGYNVGFDLDFMAKWFKKHDKYGFGSYCNWRQIDPLHLVRFANYCGYLDLPNYKLETVCNQFGIKIEAHDAFEDIRATRELIGKLKEYMFPIEQILEIPLIKQAIKRGGEKRD